MASKLKILKKKIDKHYSKKDTKYIVVLERNKVGGQERECAHNLGRSGWSANAYTHVYLAEISDLWRRKILFVD